MVLSSILFPKPFKFSLFYQNIKGNYNGFEIWNDYKSLKIGNWKFYEIFIKFEGFCRMWD